MRGVRGCTNAHANETVLAVVPFFNVTPRLSRYPAFLARIEGAALTCLGHASVQVRLLALALLRSVASCRRARRTAHAAHSDPVDGPWSASVSPWLCIADVLDTHGDDIVQRGLFQFMLQGAGGFVDNLVLAQSSSPPIEKVASGYGDMWEYVLAQLVFATLHAGPDGSPVVHPHIALEAQRILMDQLQGPMLSVPGNPKATEEAKATWKSTHVLLVSMAAPPPSKEIEEALLAAASATGGGSFRRPQGQAGAGAVPALMKRHASTMWTPLVPDRKRDEAEADWSRDALQVACLCAHVVGVNALATSLWEWYVVNEREREREREMNREPHDPADSLVCVYCTGSIS